MSNDTSIKVTTVTPELAEAWMGKNTHNRQIRDRVVAAYSRDMANGDWQWNGEAIKFAEDGTLIDGQHRLSAIVQAGVPVQMLVIFGVEMDAQHTMDTGAKRTIADALRLRGEAHNRILGAGIKSCIVWDSGLRNFGGGARITATATEAIDYLASHPELREYARQTSQVNKYVKLPSSISVLAMKLFYEIDHEDAEHFFARLASDEGHYKGQPIHALRRALIAELYSNGQAISRTATWKLAVIIKAWNKFRLGEDIQILNFKAGGSRPETFPEPI